MHVSFPLNLTQIQETGFNLVILLIRVLKSFSLHCEIEITKPKKKTQNCILFTFILHDSTVSRQPNIKPSLSDQTNIALNLFNTILQTTNSQVELERSWATIERDINIQEN